MKTHYGFRIPLSLALILPWLFALGTLNAQNVSVSNQTELEAAIVAANAGTITSITLTTNIVLTSALTPIAPPSATLSIQGTGFSLSRDPASPTSFRILAVYSGSTSVSDLTISGGEAALATTSGMGGGIFNSSPSLTLTNCSLLNNVAESYGGGLHNEGFTILDHCTLSSNTANWGGGVSTETSMDIQGGTMINGNQSWLLGGGIYNSANLTIDNTTITANNSSSSGGGIYHSIGTLTISNATLSSNTTAFGLGGGIGLYNATLTVSDSAIIGNESDAYGGGIGLSSGSSAVVERTRFESNFSGLYGGAIYGSQSIITVLTATIHDNVAADSGGGVFVLDTELTINNSSLSDNQASNGGGLNANTDSLAFITNSTFSNNTGSSAGGGLYIAATTTLTNCTISGNHATPSPGGGIFHAIQDLTLRRCIVSGNQASDGSEYYFNSGTTTVDAYNVFGHSGLTTAQALFGLTPGASDVSATSNGTQPTALASILSPTLALNGGSTPNLALVAGSPAIDLAPAIGSYPSTDQRGVSRPQGAGIDAGAYEWQDSPLPPSPSVSVSEAYTHHATANTISANTWNLDPNGILGGSPTHTLISGNLPSGLGFDGTTLRGYFSKTGTFRFSVLSSDGSNEVRNHFIIQVIPPTLTPFIHGLWVNGTYEPTIVIQERTHGDAAITELFNLTVSAGDPLNLSFEWDFIKGDYAFTLIRGSLPSGLTLRETTVNGLPTAVIEGIPTQTGEFIFVVSIKDWRERGYQWIRLVVE